MAISPGDSIPSVSSLATMTSDGPSSLTTSELFDGKKVVLFAVPGAFTPTCSAAHLPGFVEKTAELKAKGIDDIVCMSVNDVFVMDAWGKAHNADSIKMVADPDADFARAVDLTLDLSERGLGVRSARYAMVVDNGSVTALHVDEGGALEKSSADSVLASL